VGNRDVADFVAVDGFQHRRATRVAGRAEGIPVAERKVEVGLLEGQSHGAYEGARPRRRRGDGIGLTPEVVRARMIFELFSVGSDASEVQATVPLLVLEDAKKMAPQRRARVGPLQQRPRKELDRHEFVVSEARQTAGPRPRIPQRIRWREFRGAAAEGQTRSALRAPDRERGAGLGVLERRAAGASGRGEFDRQFALPENALAEFAHARRSRCFGSHGANVDGTRQLRYPGSVVRPPSRLVATPTAPRRRATKARRIGRILDRLFPEPEIPLEHVDPYTLLIAVVLSAQCTDMRVNQVAPELFAKADRPEKMARLPVRTIERIIRPCGLAPAKAKAIRKLSALLVEKHGGVVPASFDALESLPGVGHKTASVVMSQAFGEPAFPIDTHIHRLAGRWGLSRARSVTETERDLKRLFPVTAWGRRHLQIIYFARAYCPARGHDLDACPICSWAASQRRKALERRR